MSVEKSKRQLQAVEEQSFILDTDIGKLNADLKLSVKVSKIMYFGKVLDEFCKESVAKCPSDYLSSDAEDEKEIYQKLFINPPFNLAGVLNETISKINSLGIAIEETLTRINIILCRYNTLLRSFDLLEGSLDDETILLLAFRMPEVSDSDNNIISILKSSIEHLKAVNV